jgi:hypothetical protein
MSNEPGQNDARPRQCPACGTWVNGPMKFCPECGANQLAAATRAAAAREAASHHLRPQFFAVGSVAVFAVAFTAYGILHHNNDRDQTPGVQAQGPVLASQSTPAVIAPQDAPAVAVTRVPVTPEAPHSSAAITPSVAPAAPATARAPATPVTVATAPAPATQTVVVDAPPGQPEPPAATHLYTAQRNASLRRVPDERAFDRKASTSMRADVARNLASARASLDKNDLVPARRALMNALAEQPGNGQAQQMKAELASREGERDSLLGYARLCARDGQWVCAWHNAGHALTVDASSVEARDLLSRAIAEHGATASRSFDPSLPENQ